MKKLIKILAVYLGALVLFAGDLSFAASPAGKKSLCFLFDKFPLQALPQRQVTESVDHILISKSKKLMITWHGKQISKIFNVALGSSSAGHKVQQGDGKTPTGFYKISAKKENSDFYRALQISYPNANDIKAAKALGVDPGGDIMIHGLPSDSPNKRLLVALVHPQYNWTRGCIAVDDSEIEEVYANTKVGATVEICE